jgi:hypothetical protein
MAAPYIAEDEAQSRLMDRFGIDDEPYPALLELASNELDQRGGPWIGDRYSGSSGAPSGATGRVFPRSIQPDGTATDATNAAIPEEVLDYIVLRAAELTSEPEAAISSRSVGDLSISYAGGGKRPRQSVLVELAWKALEPWRRRTASIAGEENIYKMPHRTVS